MLLEELGVLYFDSPRFSEFDLTCSISNRLHSHLEPHQLEKAPISQLDCRIDPHVPRALVRNLGEEFLNLLLRPVAGRESR